MAGKHEKQLKEITERLEQGVNDHAGLDIYSLNQGETHTLINTQEDILEMGTEGIFGVEDREWDNYRTMESAREGKREQDHRNEDLFFSSSQDRYAIYQIRDDGQGRKYLFMGTEYLKKQGFSVEYDDYQMVYSDVPDGNETLDSLYEKFNIRRPLDFTGHSLSVSDVIALKKDGEITAHYVDSFGYTELPEFFSQKEKDIVQEKETEAQEHSQQELRIGDINKPYEKVYPPLYTHTIAYAKEHGRAEDFLESRKLNLECKKAIEDAIRVNFDGMHLAHDAAKGVLEEYGAERVGFILANTVRYWEYDGRLSRDNRTWAEGYGIPENVSQGMDRNADYVVSSHPAVLDGFIALTRDWMPEYGLGTETKMEEKTGVATQEPSRDMDALETQSARAEKMVENAPKTDRGISGGSKRQSVLNALRERQARIKEQGTVRPGQVKQGQKAQSKKKGELEL